MLVCTILILLHIDSAAVVNGLKAPTALVRAMARLFWTVWFACICDIMY